MWLARWVIGAISFGEQPAAFAAPIRMNACRSTVFRLIPILILAGLLGAARAEEVSIPDPGLRVYTFFSSTDLVVWSELVIATNTIVSIRFDDSTAHLSPLKFYRARFAP